MTRVLVTGTRAPVALHLVRLMAGAGHHVLMADSLPCPMAEASRMHQGFHLCRHRAFSLKVLAQHWGR
ncbi:hypothetical protein MASR1M32_34080 [Rhodobacter sp.]